MIAISYDYSLWNLAFQNLRKASLELLQYTVKTIDYKTRQALHFIIFMHTLVPWIKW